MKVLHTFSGKHHWFLLSILFMMGSSTVTFAQSPTMTRNFDMGPGGELEVSTSGGGISVEGSNSNEVEVKVFVKKNKQLLSSSDPLVRRIEEGFDISMSLRGNTLKISTRKHDRSSEWRNVSISFQISTPERVSTNLTTSGGGISLAMVDGVHELHTSGGGITLESISGKTRAITSGGGIKVSDQQGDLTAETSGGGISISRSKGDIDARTSGGGIVLKDLDGEVDARTSGGAINIYGSAESIRAVTSGGSIRAEIDGLRESLFLETSGGNITAVIPGGIGMNLDLKGLKVNTDGIKNFSGDFKKNHVDGTINGGGIPVHMHASGGNVRLELR